MDDVKKDIRLGVGVAAGDVYVAEKVFIVLFDDPDGGTVKPKILGRGVDLTDALAAAAALLQPLLVARPELKCRTLGSLVALADYRICEDCESVADCPLQDGPDEKEEVH